MMNMEKPPPNPAKLLSAWMEWERGDLPPGRTLADLKIAGMRELLEDLASKVAEPGNGNGGPAAESEPPSAEVWKPVV